jgi:dihydroxyacid dehydratase/phosphogluconate dehydratase
MKSRNYLYLVWLIPAYLAFLLIHQAKVFYDFKNTMTNGTIYDAEVTDFRIKQIAAQTNGYIVVKFTTDTGQVIERQLALGIQHAARLMETEQLQIKYYEESGQEIVLVPTFEAQQQVIRFNMMMLSVSLLLLIGVSAGVTRYISRRKSGKIRDTPTFEMIH